MKPRDAIGTAPVQQNAALHRDSIPDDRRVAYPLPRGVPAAVAVDVLGARVQGFAFDGQYQARCADLRI